MRLVGSDGTEHHVLKALPVISITAEMTKDLRGNECHKKWTLTNVLSNMIR